MDKAGDLAVGYSKSSSSVNPSIAFAGRVPTDPSGTLEAETGVVSGTGSQTGLTRWGDYSAMTVDPSDDCTFWYTQEYIKTNGTFNWSTRIANFKFPNCGALVTLAPTSLAFPSQVAGTASAPQTITLSNLQATALTGISIATTGDFGQTNNCGASLAANSSCTINVTFTPTQCGARAGTLTVTDSAGSQSANLTGTGISGVSLNPAALAFGNQGLNTTSTLRGATLTNNQSGSLTGIALSFTGANPADFRAEQQLRDLAGRKIRLHHQRNLYAVRVRHPDGDPDRDRQRRYTDERPDGNRQRRNTADHSDHRPANGATVSGAVTVTATANDNAGVTSLQIYIDGALKTSEYDFAA